MLTFGGELDHGPIVEFSDFSALGNIAAHAWATARMSIL
jgi:hypothetical protein